MKLNSLNNKHEEMLQKYLLFVQGTVYSATEDYDVKKFSDFNEIMENVIDYTNAFSQIIKNSSRRRAEWAYMTPNLILYSCMGFLAGLKDSKSEELIDDLAKDLFDKTVDFVGETSDILQDMQIKEDIQRELLTKRKQKNETT